MNRFVQISFFWVLSLIGFYVIRFLVIYTLLFGIYGAGATGSEKAQKTYDLFGVKHLPVLIPIFIIMISLRQDFRNKQKDKIKWKVGLLTLIIVSYIVLESTSLL